MSNIGTWMHDVGAAWLMTGLTPDPLIVALVQSATTLPIFLLALPSGALADIVDRRRLLIGAQLWSAVMAATLALVALSGAMSPVLLLLLTFALSIGAALSAPAFQAIVPELVPREALADAVALNGLGINIARAIGPAIGGLIVAAAGSAAVFALNAASVVGIILVLLRWRRDIAPASLPPEHFPAAVRAGLRYARSSPPLQTVLVRSAGVFLFASAFWALLPLVARMQLGLDAAGYGLLLACMGTGAVAGALARSTMRRRWSANAISRLAGLLFAGAMAVLAIASSIITAGLALGAAGFAWILTMTMLNYAAQTAAPGWVRARALSVAMLVFQGAMTFGAAGWGALAGTVGVTAALGVAAGGCFLAVLLLSWRFPLAAGDEDLSPSGHWAEPVLAGAPDDQGGPVLVTIDYQVEASEAEGFIRAMQALCTIRRRDGAYGWSLYEDAARPGCFVETFTLPSWLEHLRQHARVTNADRLVQDAANAFHHGSEPPRVRHLLTRRARPIILRS